MSERIQLRVLGPVTLEYGEKSIRRFRSRRAAELLALLAARQPHRIRRREAAELIWPDLNPEARLVNLRQSIHYIRGALQSLGAPADSLISDNDFLELPKACWEVDLDNDDGGHSLEFAEGLDAEWLDDFRNDSPVEPERKIRNTLRRPAAPTLFGREEESRFVIELLQNREPLVTLTGLAGVGKSAVAREVLHQWSLRGNLVQAWTLSDLRSTLQAGRLPGAELISIDCGEVGLAECAPVVRRLLRDPNSPQVIVTARSPLDLPGERVVPIRLLPLPEAGGQGGNPAIAIMLHAAGRRFGEAEARHLPELAARSAGLPSALVLIGRRLAVFSPSELLDQLGSPEAEDILKSCGEDILDQAPDNLRDGLGILSLFTRPFRAAMAASMWPGSAGPEAISKLCASSVLISSEGDDPRFRLVEPVRRLLESRLTVPQKDASMRRMVHGFHRLWGAWGRADSSGMPSSVRRTLEPEIADVERAAIWAWRNDMPEAWELAWVLVRWHISEHRSIRLLSFLAELDDRPLPSAPAQPILLLHGSVMLSNDFFQEAATALDDWLGRSKGKDIWTADALCWNATSRFRIGKPGFAEMLAEGMHLFDELGMPERAARIALAVHWSLQTFPQKEQTCRRAMAMATARGDQQLYADACMVLAQTERMRGRIIAAKVLATEALATYVELDEPVSAAVGEAFVGRIDEDLGQIESALKQYHSAIAILEQGDNVFQLCIALTFVADLYTTRGKLEEAMDIHRRCIRLRSRPGLEDGLATNWKGLGRAQLEAKHYAESILSLGFAITSYTENGHINARATAIGYQGIAQVRNGQTQEGMKQIAYAMSILEPLTETQLNWVGPDTRLLVRLLRAEPPLA